MRYAVQEFAVGRFYTVRLFAERDEAESFALWLSRKARVVALAYGGA
jgi:hypothetical protein